MPSLMMFIFLYLVSFILVLSGDDWFLVWLGLEVNMLSFLMLIYSRFDQSCMEACLKYFFVQSLGSAMFMGLFYLNKGYLSDMIVVIMSYKMGAAPLYFWFPSVCSGLGWLSCFMLMTFQSIMPLMLVAMFMSWLVWVVMGLSLMFGVFGSFNQVNIKMLLAFSSIHHLGWIFLCNLYEDVVWIFYLLLYGIILYGIVIIVKEEEINYMLFVKKLKNKWWFVLNMLSMAGMPPLLGFFLSWMAFIYIMSINILFVVMMVVMSVIMFYVYLRIIYDVFTCYELDFSYKNYCMDFDFNFKIEMISLFGLFLGLGMIVLMFLW
uniref:NADH dehydrogenase subunit 2 n=1 Tax=Plator insolens TaxID=2880587 RepID=UPI001F1348A5|nr:NADH dehydrogenase subunit 2 [Plator insolens]UMI39143.1 NADH dehydrogenase subunit 2 [Plator insolens]